MASAAQSSPDAFRMQLTVAAPESALQAWFDDAPPGERTIYASGFTYPREADGVKLVTAWERAGLVTLTSGRDPDDRRRSVWFVARTAEGIVRTKPKRDFSEDLVRVQMRNLLDELRRAAERGLPCPSRSVLAGTICAQRTRKGRDRIGYLLRRLVAEGKITMASGDATRAPIVTITAKGRAKGKSTIEAPAQGARAKQGDSNAQA